MCEHFSSVRILYLYLCIYMYTHTYNISYHTMPLSLMCGASNPATLTRSVGQVRLHNCCFEFFPLDMAPGCRNDEIYFFVYDGPGSWVPRNSCSTVWHCHGTGGCHRRRGRNQRTPAAAPRQPAPGWLDANFHRLSGDTDVATRM